MKKNFPSVIFQKIRFNKKIRLFSILIALLNGSRLVEAKEVFCNEKNWSFSIVNQYEIEVGLLAFRNNVLEVVAMEEKSIESPEFSDLAALYEGETSQDSYSLFVFKEPENEKFISFLETRSKLIQDKKIIEFRCTLKD